MNETMDEVRAISHFTRKQFEVMCRASELSGEKLSTLKLSELREIGKILSKGKADVGERVYHILERATKNAEKTMMDLVLLVSSGYIDVDDIPSLFRDSLASLKKKAPSLYKEIIQEKDSGTLSFYY